jgi:tripartite ATP-independent transporter DctP family solute receptor
VTLSRRHLLAGGVAGVLAGCSAPDRLGRPLIVTDSHPADYPTVVAMQWMADELARATGGRLALDIFAGGQLGEEKDTLELTIFGGIDMNRVNLAPLNAIAAETLVPTLPFLFDSIAHMRRAMDGAPGAAVLRALEPHGLIGLAFYDSGARGFYTVNRPVRAPADLAGAKIRVQNSDLFVATIQALGAAATPMSYGEVFQGLTQGVIDGAENNEPSYESSRHFEAAPFFTPTAHVMAPEVLTMARHRWERLDPADRKLILATARQSVAVMRAAWDAREASAIARLRAAGVTFVAGVDREAFRARVLPVWQRFLTTPALRRLAADMAAA